MLAGQPWKDVPTHPVPAAPLSSPPPAVSLSDFLTLFSARTHDGFFWSSAPSWMLLVGACMSMGISTIIACFWPANVATFWTDGIPCRGLALGDYKLWALWVWIYCVVWWWIQDACKVGFYWCLHRFNLFNVNTAQLVNVRDKTDFGDKNSLARMSAGVVEGKLLEKQVGGWPGSWRALLPAAAVCFGVFAAWPLPTPGHCHLGWHSPLPHPAPSSRPTG